MENKDAAVIKALAELGLRKEAPLSPEQERMLQVALDPNEQYLEDLLKIFNRTE
jgi:hypothetical protein